MRLIPTNLHGILDYVLGVFLILSPWLLGFATGGVAMWVPVLFGVGILAYSLFTDYEMGAIKKLPLSGHLSLDFIAGLILAISPWLFGFAHLVFAPHLVIGLVFVGLAILTPRVPSPMTHRHEAA
jgi:hypothetical protein